MTMASKLVRKGKFIDGKDYTTIKIMAKVTDTSIEQTVKLI